MTTTTDTSSTGTTGTAAPTPLAQRLHHTAYVTKDQEATRAFDEDILGFPLVATWSEADELFGALRVYCHTFFELADGSALAFFQFANQEDQDLFDPELLPSPFRHIALKVDADGQAELERRLQEANWKPDGTDGLEHGYCRSLYTEDPNGMLLEFTVDVPEVDDIAEVRRRDAHETLARWLGISVFDVMTGLHGTIGVLAALNQRRETGEGQHVEVNLLSSAMSGLVNHTGAYAAASVVPNRMGNAHPSVYPYQPMPTKDRDVIIAAANDRQFRSLCEVLEIPEVADDPRFELNADRTANREELHPILLERLSVWTADDLFIALDEVGVPCGPINSIADGMALAEQLGLQPRVTVGEGDREVDLVRNPLSFSAAEPDDHSPPPRLGEHGDAIREWLATPASR